MHSILIERPGTVPLELAEGQSATFGRGSQGSQPDVLLDDPAVSRTAGRITAVGSHWTLTNLSATATYVIENPEGGGEFLKVAPRRQDCPVPFEMARVLLPGLDQVVAFQVYTSGPSYVDDAPAGSEGDLTLVSAFRLDQNAKYFLVLLAMCEPRLRDESSVAVPSVPAVVRRLQALPSCADITPAAVTFHIDYLTRIKLRLRDGEAARRGESRGASLVATALRFNLIREEHLTLLPPRQHR